MVGMFQGVRGATRDPFDGDVEWWVRKSIDRNEMGVSEVITDVSRIETL